VTATAHSSGYSEDRAAADRRARTWLLGAVLLTTTVALASTGAYHDDDLKHYLFARWARHDPAYLVHTWGRPGFTLLYALPAQMGWRACRLVSVALSAIAAWAAYRSARRLGLTRAEWTIPLLYAQPLFLHLATTTLTETPAAACLALATWAMSAGRRGLSAAVFSVTLITRHESVVLLPVWAWALWRRSAPAAGPHETGAPPVQDPRAGMLAAWALLPWAPVAYNLITRAAFGYWPGEIFVQPAGATHYGRGTPLTFVVKFGLMAGPVVAAFALVGLRRLWDVRAARPLVAGVAAYVAAQTLLYMFQAYATGGYARFLVPLAPWISIAALAGIRHGPGLPERPGIPESSVPPMPPSQPKPGQRRASGSAPGVPIAAAALWLAAEAELAWNPVPRLAPYAWLVRAGVLALLGALALRSTSRAPQLSRALIALALLGPAAWAAWPHRLRPREQAIARAVAELRNLGLLDRDLYSTSDWTYLFADRWYPAPTRPLYERLADAAPGSILVWEPRYGPSPDFELPLGVLRADPRWKELPLAVPAEKSGSVHVFERR